MRIAFIVIGNSRRSNYINGYNLRYGGGSGSGTDTSSILVAEYLAKQGHEVVFATDELEPKLEEEHNNKGIKYIPGSESYLVTYTNINFDGIKNKEFDMLINMLWFQEYDSLPITITKSIIYWSHMQWVYGTKEFVTYAEKNNLSVGLVHISKWEEEMNKDVFSYIQSVYQNSKKTIIPNPIFDEMINEVLNQNIRIN